VEGGAGGGQGVEGEVNDFAFWETGGMHAVIEQASTAVVIDVIMGEGWGGEVGVYEETEFEGKGEKGRVPGIIGALDHCVNEARVELVQDTAS
jgi:hypothetical protein